MAHSVPDTVRKNGIYRFKKRVPNQLVDKPPFKGKKFIEVSLRTRDRSEAMKRAHQERQAFDAMVRNAEYGERRTESGLLGRSHIPTERDLRLAALEFKNSYIERHPMYADAETLFEYDATGPEDAAGGRSVSYWEQRAQTLLEDPFNDETVKCVDEIVAKRGWQVPEDSNLLFKFAVMLAGVEKQAIDIINIPEKNLDALLSSATTQSSSLRLEEAVCAYLEENGDRPEMAKKMRTAVDMWSAFGGPSYIAHIQAGDVYDFIEQLKKLPARWKDHFPGLSPTDAILAHSKRCKPLRRMSAKTIKDNYTSILCTACNRALKRQEIASNPFSGKEVKGARSHNPNKRAFETHELQQIFSHPIFTGCHSRMRRNTKGSVILRDHYFWAPLLALFTGARASEIATVSMDCVVIESPFPHIKILGTKTENAKRKVPIHPKLIEIGFESYVVELRNRKENRLFPEWKKPSGKHYSSGSAIKNFNEKVVRVIGEETPPTFHCFRHTLKAEMIGLSSQFQRYILGQVQEGIDRNYLKNPQLSQVYHAFCQNVRFADVDLTHLAVK